MLDLNYVHARGFIEMQKPESQGPLINLLNGVYLANSTDEITESVAKHLKSRHTELFPRRNYLAEIRYWEKFYNFWSIFVMLPMAGSVFLIIASGYPSLIGIALLLCSLVIHNWLLILSFDGYHLSLSSTNKRRFLMASSVGTGILACILAIGVSSKMEPLGQFVLIPMLAMTLTYGSVIIPLNWRKYDFNGKPELNMLQWNTYLAQIHGMFKELGEQEITENVLKELNNYLVK